MAPNISKIDPDCYPNLGASPWFFRDEVLRMPFHPHSLSLLQSDRSHPSFEQVQQGSEFGALNLVKAPFQELRFERLQGILALILSGSGRFGSVQTEGLCCDCTALTPAG
jgi:hypothetical protein